MEQRYVKANVQSLIEFWKESQRYLMNLGNCRTIDEFKQSLAFNYLKNAIHEICRALEKENGTVDQDIEIFIEDSFQNPEKYLSKYPAMDAMDFNHCGSGILQGVIILCKKNGIFPYYTTYIAAAALHYVIQHPVFSPVKEIIKNGIKQTVIEMMHFEYEAEMAYLITEAYQEILDEKPFFKDGRKIELIRTAYEEGFRNESLYGGCSQCVIKSFFTVAKIGDDKSLHLFKAASSLAGGVAGCNDGTCGALIGAGMMIGSYLGREIKNLDDPEDPAYEKSNDVFRKIRDKFVGTYETTLCNQVHSCIFGRKFNFRCEKDFEEFEKAGAHVDKCCCVVGMASAWLCEALYNEKLIE